MWMFAVAAAAPPDVTVPAAGRHEVVVSIPAFGRYALAVASEQGTSLQVVDAMNGPGPTSGEPGRENGRQDLFLDRGRIKVVLTGDPRASGNATLAVRPFTEAETSARLLPPEREISTSLGQTQQRSYWIDVAADRTVTVEASGRYVGDLRFWRDGSWLVAAEPTCDTVTPTAGRPWRSCVLSADLPAGLTLVTVYGGEGEPWAYAGPEAPLVIREGARKLGTAGQLAGTIGPSGRTRLQIPEGITTVRLALAEVEPATLACGSTLASVDAEAQIAANARQPAVNLSPPGAGWLTISGRPGAPFQLTWFGPVETTIPAGSWYITSVHAADARDVLDPTAVLFTALPDQTWRRTLAQGIPLDRGHRIERSFNLTGRTSALLDVGQAGPYRITLEGERTTVQIRPMVQGPPLPFADAMAGSNDLDVGLYELLLDAGAPTVATLRIAPENGVGDLPITVLRSTLSFGNVNLGAEHRLAAATPPGVPWGLVRRALPLDPTDPVPMALLPGETAGASIRVEEAGVLRATAVNGESLSLSVDGGPWGTAARVRPGTHPFSVRAERATTFTVAFTPDSAAPDRPLPSLSAGRSGTGPPGGRATGGLPKFPVVAPGRPVGLDLVDGETKTASLSLPAPGLYRVESTGLLATAGTLRTRTTTHLASAERNGIGRNFVIGRYLGSGDYQISVQALEGSIGHVGLRVVRTRIDDGGDLPPDTEARATVLADAAIRYTVQIDEPGWYHLRHDAAGNPMRCRLEDEDGWPLVAPDQRCDHTLELAPGRYVLLGSPHDVETRRRTTVDPIRPPSERSGHGPFALGLGEPTSHVWTESPDRTPDRFTIAVPAPIHGTLALSPEMSADLLVNGQLVGKASPGQAFDGPIPAGELRIEVRGVRVGTGLPYTLTLTSREMVAGAERQVQGPTRIPVAVGTAGIYTFASRGSTDVRARLLDADGRAIGANDDRPDDWNFRLTRRLEPGTYTLVVEPMVAPAQPAVPVDTGWGPVDTGAWEEPHFVTASEPTVVEMRAPAEVEGPSLTGSAVQVPLDDRAVVMPVTVRTGADVVVAQAKSAENVGIAIEVQDGSRWRVLADATGRSPIAVARVQGAPLRVRVWSEDLRSLPATVSVGGLVARPLLAAELARGFGGGGPSAVRVRGAGGPYRIVANDSLGAGLFACTAGDGCPPVSGSIVGGADGLVLVSVGRPARAELLTLRDRAMHLELDGCRLADDSCGIDVSGTGPVAVIARAPVGQPVVAFDRGFTAIALGAALAVAVEGGGRAALWDGSGASALDVSLTRVSLDRSPAQVAPLGRTALVVPARGALEIGLGAPARLAIGLEAGLVTAVDGLGAVWADAAGTTVHIARATEQIALVNPTDQPRHALIDSSPAEAGLEVSPNVPFERLGIEEGTWLVPVAEAEATLRVRGAQAVYLAADGRVGNADGARIGPGGTAIVATHPGPALLWADAGAGGPIAEVDAGDPVDVVGSGVVPLFGSARRLRVQPTEAKVASVVVPVPAIVKVAVSGRPDRIEVLAAGDRLDLVTGGSAAYVLIRAFRGAALHGDAVVTSSTVVPTAEGIGPEQLVAGNGVVFYTFTAERTGPVGIGTRTSAGRIDAVLYDAQGAVLARGALAMVDLAPGRYLLALSQPTGSVPVRVQPTVVGLSPPPSTPPPEIVRQYRR